MCIDIGCWGFWLNIFIGYAPDKMRAASIRIGSVRVGVSNWYSWSFGRWSYSVETKL